MSAKRRVATPGQEQHMRAMLEGLRSQGDYSLTAWSELLIGSSYLLDFQRGSALTNTLLQRVLIGLKAQGLPMSRERLLGPEETSPVATPLAVAQEMPDPLGPCVECLTKAFTDLTDVAKKLTSLLIAIADVAQDALNAQMHKER